MYTNGDEYTGDWKNNKRHGKGVFISMIGDKYEGDWSNDMKHGIGR